MTIKKFRFLLLPALALCLGSHASLAATVYQWTDDDGVVHFSDVPPRAGAGHETEEIEFGSYGNTDSDAAADEYSIVNQLQTMTAWRQEAAAERRARKQLYLEEQRLQDDVARESRPLVVNESRQSGYYPVLPYYQGYPGYYPQRPGRSLHPRRRHNHDAGLPGHGPKPVFKQRNYSRANTGLW